MNIRELLDKIDNIAVKESITMQDVQAAIAGKTAGYFSRSFQLRGSADDRVGSRGYGL